MVWKKPFRNCFFRNLEEIMFWKKIFSNFKKNLNQILSKESRCFSWKKSNVFLEQIKPSLKGNQIFFSKEIKCSQSNWNLHKRNFLESWEPSLLFPGEGRLLLKEIFLKEIFSILLKKVYSTKKTGKYFFKRLINCSQCISLILPSSLLQSEKVYLPKVRKSQKEIVESSILQKTKAKK